MCSSIWGCSAEQILNFSAFSILSFLHNHHNLQVFGHPQSLRAINGSHDYVKKLKEDLEHRGCQIRLGCLVQSISKLDRGCLIICEDGSEERCNGCIIATHAPDALKMIGEQATYEEKRILGAFNYVYSDMFLHRDTRLMPKNQTTWSACNFGATIDNKVYLTYWLNVIQNIDDKGLTPFLVTINPPLTPESTILKWSTRRLVPSLAASKALLELHTIQGKRNIVFCGAYQGYGSHEDGVKAAIDAANAMIVNKGYETLDNPKHMVPSWMEAGARSFIVKFLQDYIAIGTLILIEEGGTIFTFKGTTRKSLLKVYAKVHNPQFYWKIVTKADLGLAEAYINGDFTLIDKNKGLQDMLTCHIANSLTYVRNINQWLYHVCDFRGWWTPIFLTAGILSAKYFFRHVMRKNTVTQARNNISQHYDLSNEHFSIFLDETMTYSCAIFMSEDEDLKSAQMRKISSLIVKARVEKHHEVLDIGCVIVSIHDQILSFDGWFWLFICIAFSKILALGFNQEFIRTWEYYFDSTAAGFKTETLMNYQVVFSRPGNMNATF
ncbi:hypothetical protein R6Q59_012055 [Mikania micrantha]